MEADRIRFLFLSERNRCDDRGDEGDGDLRQSDKSHGNQPDQAGPPLEFLGMQQREDEVAAEQDGDDEADKRL